MNIHLVVQEALLTNDIKHENIFEYDNFLMSFAYFVKSPKLIDVRMKKIFSRFSDKKIILDSGAFSMATGAVSFDIKEYIKFLQQYGHLFCTYVNLDVPLLHTTSSDPVYIQYSIDTSQKNLKILEDEGLKPLPVYQRIWNQYDILESYLEKYEYVCIGGIAGGIHISQTVVMKYLDKVFELNSKYKRKLHGLGQTQDIILKQYPFYSVDSTSWLYGAIDFLIYINIMETYKLIETGKKEFNKKVLSPILFDEYKNHKYPAYVTRCDYNIKFYYNYQRILRELWNERGVKWDEYSKSKHFSNQK